jgi:hypothetical protein
MAIPITLQQGSGPMNESQQIIELCIQALKDASHILPDDSTEYVPDVVIVTSMLTLEYQWLLEAKAVLPEARQTAAQILNHIGHDFAQDNLPHMSCWFLLAGKKVN